MVIYLGIIHKRSPKTTNPGDSTNGSGPCGWGAGFVVWDSNRDAVPQNPKPPRKTGGFIRDQDIPSRELTYRTCGISENHRLKSAGW